MKNSSTVKCSTANNDDYVLDYTTDVPHIKRVSSMKFESVQKFVLSHCRDLIALNLRSLTTMYIESQKLEAFELNPDYIPSLEIISLGYNRLKNIPSFLYKLKNIQNIYLNNNKIKTIKVPRMAKVEVMWLSYNKICSMDYTIGYLVSLKFLHLDHNRICRINATICYCVDLAGLWIGYNHIKKIPLKLCEASALSLLDIEHNKVLELPKTVRRRKKLRIICHGNFLPSSHHVFEVNMPPTKPQPAPNKVCRSCVDTVDEV